MDKLNLTSRFTSNKLTSSTALQGVLFKGSGNTIHMYATNLNAYIHTTIKTKVEEEFQIVIEPKKVIEFLHFLTPGDVVFELKEKQITITKEKTKGNFALMVAEDFPMPPVISEKEQTLKTSFFKNNLPYVLFAASNDDARPTLTGVNFVTNEDLIMVSTDGFRLSLIKTKKEIELPSVIIPASFLGEVLKYVKDQKELVLSYSPQEKIILFKLGDLEFYTRLIDGEFPPFDRVIPTEKTATAIVEREELLRNVRLISVFARDYSNVIILEFTKDGLRIKPKVQGEEENVAFQEITLEGEEHKVAFNFKFLLDFLNHVDDEKIIIELLRSNAPVVFKSEKNKDYSQAIQQYRRLLEYAPDSQLTLDSANRAGELSLYQTQDYKGAIQFFKHIIRHGQDFEMLKRTQKQIAEIYYEKLSDYAQAVVEYSRYVELAKGKKEDLEDVEARLVRSYYYSSNYEQTFLEATHFLESYPESKLKLEIWLIKANALLAQKRPQEAVKIFDQIISAGVTGPQVDEVYIGKAQAYEDMKDLDKAINTLKTAKEIQINSDLIDIKLKKISLRKSFPL
jgi:DNA polymerase-3 subunit beta